MKMTITPPPPTPSPDDKILPSCRRRWRQSRLGAAVVVVAALLFSTTAWLSLVFSGTTTHTSLHLKHPQTSSSPKSFLDSTLLEFRNSTKNFSSFNNIVFGIAGSSQLWKRRKEFVKLWWRPGQMRGYIWLEEQVQREQEDELLPQIMVSEDISRFRYTNPTGHPSGLRISRIVSECFRLDLLDVHWFVLGDDDTIFNVDNLVAVLGKYDPSEMFYIGSSSESHSANTYFSHSMAFGGGGIAISRPLAEALSKGQDSCLDRYPKLYGSDDRLHACITEIGVPLTRELGFHQWDIRGNAHGLLANHPVAPFVSIHHVEAVDPIYPGLSSLESLKLFTKAMKADASSILQRSVCYDHVRQLTFSVSVGYVVQVFPRIVLPRELDRSELTYSAWNRIRHRNEFDFDTRDPYKSVCKRPILFFLQDVRKQGNMTFGYYGRSRQNDTLRRKVFCFPRQPPLRYVKKILVLGYPLRKKWHLVPRRLCCKLNQTRNELVRLTVGQCDEPTFGSMF